MIQLSGINKNFIKKIYYDFQQDIDSPYYSRENILYPDKISIKKYDKDTGEYIYEDILRDDNNLKYKQIVSLRDSYNCFIDEYVSYEYKNKYFYIKYDELNILNEKILYRNGSPFRERLDEDILNMIPYNKIVIIRDFIVTPNKGYGKLLIEALIKSYPKHVIVVEKFGNVYNDDFDNESINKKYYKFYKNNGFKEIDTSEYELCFKEKLNLWLYEN